MSKLSEHLNKKISIKDIDMIVEEQIRSSDKKTIEKLIDNPKSIKFNLKSYSKTYKESKDRVFEVSDAGKFWMMEFNDDFYELAEFITDIFDKKDMKFKSGFEKSTNTQWFMFEK